MMESVREALAEQTNYQPRLRRLGYRLLSCPRLLRAGSRALAAIQTVGLARLASRVAGMPGIRRFGPAKQIAAQLSGLPKIPLRQQPLRSSGSEVWLFVGCVMDAWMRDTHIAVQRVLEAAGAGVEISPRSAACCGALHSHAGLASDTRQLAQQLMEAMPGEAPILVDSAGCGAAMKEYGRLLGTTEAEAFSARVLDVHEWLSDNLERLPAGSPEIQRPVAIQDPCHLRHVQQAHQSVRTVLSRFVPTVELDDDGLCCGAGGAYSQLHPHTAAAVRDRKLESISRSGATVVASANPGCEMHLRAAGVEVAHPLVLVAELLAEQP